MQILRFFSILLLSFTASVKFNIIGISINDNIIHYLFNASLILTVFSVLVPAISNRKLEKLNIKDTERLTSILNEIETEQNIEVFISHKLIKSNIVTLFKKNQQVIVCGETLVNLLDDSQIKFLLAHEYFHIKSNDLFKNIFSFIFAISGVPILLLIVSPFLISRVPILWVLIFAFIIYIVCFILHFTFSQRREFVADKFASSIVGDEVAKNTLSLLQKQNLLPEKSYSLFETHPSINKRIEKVS